MSMGGKVQKGRHDGQRITYTPTAFCLCTHGLLTWLTNPAAAPTPHLLLGKPQCCRP